MATCDSCGAPIVWRRTIHGTNIPLDAHPESGRPLVVEDGNLILVEASRIVRYVKAGQGRHRTHFATCPDSKQWRKKR
jgi:hypothetical protein